MTLYKGAIDVTDILTSLTKEIEDSRATRTAAYKRLAVDLLDGGSPDANTVEAIVAEAGKTLTDLKAEIERLRDRRKLLVQMKAGAGLEEKERMAHSAIQAAEAQLQAAHHRHQANCNAPLNVLAAIEQARLQAQLARGELLRTADPVVLAEVSRLNLAIVGFDAKIQTLQCAVSAANQVAGILDGVKLLGDTPAIAEAQNQRAAAIVALHVAEQELMKVN
jgi:hypothetical protein